MDTAVYSYIKLYQFTSGRRLFVYREIKDIAKELNQPTLVAHIDKAYAYEIKVRDLEEQWLSQKGLGVSSDLRPYDNALDRSLTGFAKYCESFQHGMDEDNPTYIAASRISNAAFPNGVLAITRLPYVDELSSVEALLKKLSKDEYKDALTKLNMSLMLNNIKTKYQEFYDAYNNVKSQSVNYGDVKAARTQGQQYLVQMVAIILGTFYNDEDHVAKRQRLLTPLNRQLLRIAELVSKRRTITDVDPESGKEVSEASEEPTPSEEPANNPSA